MTMRCGWLLALLVVAGCERRSPVQRLEAFAGSWRCPMNHLTADEPGASRVVQEVTIERDAARFAVRFSPDRDQPSPEAVTSVAYWSYDSAERRFTSEAKVGDGSTAVEERYSSPGPQDGRLVWTGELRSAISVPMRMTFALTPSGLDILVEAFSDQAWKPLSTASCTRTPRATLAATAGTRSQPVLLPPVPSENPPARSEREMRELVEHGAPQSPFVQDPADRFAYNAVQATEDERRLANAAADIAQAEIDEAVELSRGTIEKSEAVTRIQKAYDERDRALDRIFGEERADVLRGIHLVEGVEVPDDGDPE